MQEREKPSPTKPSWTPLICQAPVFCKRQRAFAPHNNTLHPQYVLPLPQCFKIFSSEGFGLLLSQFLCLGLFLSCAVTGGCQQATTADTDGSPGLWWLPYVTLLLWAVFFKCFSFHHSSLSLFCFSKTARAGKERWVPLRLKRVKHDAH